MHRAPPLERPSPPPLADADIGAGQQQETGDGAEQTPAANVLVVGVGASAGGLEAFSQVLQALPANPGFAMIFVQHLAPQHESALPMLLSAHTNLAVVQAADGMPVQPDHLYVVPPNTQMIVDQGRLHLTPRPTDHSQYTPIDYFLRSLADSLQERAIAVILSGTASDGALGVREVKSVGGITIAQKPESAKYDGMPRAAIATGQVDLVLRPDEIASELVDIAGHPLRRVVPNLPRIAVSPPTDDDLEHVFRLLRTFSGVDFRRYKRPTILRRMQRRMVLHKLTSSEDYLKLLREAPAEVGLLYQDILIHVTRFFREPESFAAIGASILPKLLAGLKDDQPLRVWVPGCSTGEEPYSIAITLIEALAEWGSNAQLQVFATDISDTAIEHARGGFYPETIAADVSPERLRKFFTKVEGGYRVNRQVRDICVFARQDLIRDPPFSKLDLILCRNVLIYMGVELQAKLMSVFHYALKSTGFLVLGSAETVGIRSDLFGIADKRHRIYEKKLATSGMHVPFEYAPATLEKARRPAVERLRDDAKPVQAEVNRLVQERYAPPGVIVDGNFDIVQFRGQTGTFLAPAPGDPSMNVFKMAREGLLHGLQTTLQEARRTRRAAYSKRLRVRTNGDWRSVDLEVVPLGTGDSPHFLVLFEHNEQRRAKADRVKTRSAPTPTPSPKVARLQQELATSREYLQSIIQELEAANEELQSANEEVLSANEELQSTNEELDTAKEELQSTNEELNTVNEELHGRNEELSRSNSDLMNLLGSVQIALVIVSTDLRIRRFTPMAEQVLNLLPSDVGRPIGHLRPNIEYPNLEEKITRVIETVSPSEQVVHDREGTPWLVRIRPYKNAENRIDGAVLALFDVEVAAREDILREIRASARAIVQTMRDPVVILDRGLRVWAMNERFAGLAGVPVAAGEGRLIYELGNGPGQLSSLRAPLERVLNGTPALDGIPVQSDGASTDGGSFVMNVRRIELGPKDELMIAVALLPAPSGGG